ncbi:MAG: glycosyltransferase family 2 protein [Elusimicrobia bacterium]|nr:glycosyltransferase family 2 protein [Elusimicrobiota bacterium]
MKTTLFVPTMNEVEGMKVIMPQIRKEWVDQILIVDGGSTDGTQDYARAQGYDLYVQKKRGIRHAYIEAWPLVKGDTVITFSPDGNSPPDAIPKLIAAFQQGYDMVIGSRYKTGAKSDDDDAVTAFGNWLFTASINLFHGGRYTDAMVIYRIYRTSLFNELDLHKEESYFTEKWFGTVIGVEPLLSIRAAKSRLRVGEIPVDEPDRIGGVRKLQVLRWGAAYYAQILTETVCWKPSRKV